MGYISDDKKAPMSNARRTTFLPPLIPNTWGKRRIRGGPGAYFTVTDLARFLGLSMGRPRLAAA